MSTFNNKIELDAELQVIMQKAQELYGLMCSYHETDKGQDRNNDEKPMLDAVNKMCDVIERLSEKAGDNIREKVIENAWKMVYNRSEITNIKKTA